VSETIDDMNALKEARKHWRNEDAAANLETLKQQGIEVYEQSKNVFRMDTQHGAVMYYPTSGTWQHHGRTHKGTVQHFKTWLKNKHFL
jgi:hypothetical protein